MFDVYKEYLRYDPESGKLFWIKRPSNRVRVGDEAGVVNAFGHVAIQVRLYKTYAHRVAWELYYGDPPHGEIDHINGDPSDNRIQNLRVATRNQQLWNTKAGKRNSSGVKGVGYDPKRGSWRAYIKAHGVQAQVRAKTFEEAVLLRRKLEEKLHGQYARKVA